MKINIPTVVLLWYNLEIKYFRRNIMFGYYLLITMSLYGETLDQRIIDGTTANDNYVVKNYSIPTKLVSLDECNFIKKGMEVSYKHEVSKNESNRNKNMQVDFICRAVNIGSINIGDVK